MPKFTKYNCTCALFWFLRHNIEKVNLRTFYMTNCKILILRPWSSILLQAKIHNWIFLEELTFESFICFQDFCDFSKVSSLNKTSWRIVCLSCISTNCFTGVLCFQLCIWELKSTKFVFFRRINSNLRRQDSVSSEEVNASFESHWTTKEMSETKLTSRHVCTSLVTTILLSPPKIVRCRM